jgi:flagellar basal body-associated protein FliL
MSIAIILILIVIAVVAGVAVTLRTSANKGMPSEDVLKRATERSRKLEARDKAEHE